MKRILLPLVWLGSAAGQTYSASHVDTNSCPSGLTNIGYGNTAAEMYECCVTAAAALGATPSSPSFCPSDGTSVTTYSSSYGPRGCFSSAQQNDNKVYYNTHTSGATNPFFSPVCKTASGSSGDPHLKFANGGSADFRGIDKRVFSFLTSPDVQVNVMTEDRDFQRWSGQVVHGSFITKIFFKLRSKTGAIIRVAVHADQYAFFRAFDTDDTKTYESRTRVELPDAEALQLSGGRFVAHAKGWEIFVNRRRLRKPLSKKTSDATVASGTAERWFLDLSFNILDEKNAAKFGNSTIGYIAPHGIIGQSFDGNLIAVSGKQDVYGDSAEFTTSAQAEGAIEGTHMDYIMDSPFSTNFTYSRFDSHGPQGPRNVSVLAGIKTTVSTRSTSAGSTELHGVEK